MKNLYLIIAICISTTATSQIVNIPDSYFKNELIYATIQDDVARNASGVAIVIDANHDSEIQLSEALAVYELRLTNYDYWNQGIQSLEGLQSFTNVRYFDNINSNVNTPIDFSPLTQLTFIDISGNFQIENNPILLTGLTNLSTFKARSCNLTSINFSGLTNLTNVDLSMNDFTAINFTNLSNLKVVDISYNILISPNFDSINIIEDLNVKGDLMTTFNIAGFPNLKYLDCSSNNYTSLNLQNATTLVKLTCNGSVNSNVANFFNFTGCTGLEELYANDNYITSINLQSLVNLKIVELKSNNFNTINFSNLTHLEQIDLSGAPNSGYLTCNIQGCTSLKKFVAFSAHLTALNASNLTNLETIDCGYNTSLSSVNVTNCTALKYAKFTSNNTSASLTSLNFSTCPNLLELEARLTGMQTLNLSNCTLLRKVNLEYCSALAHLDLSCSNHYTNINVTSCTALQSLNLKNGIVDTAAILEGFNTNLTVINVDYNEHLAAFPATISQTPYYNFTPSCTYNTVTGIIKFDSESDGCANNVGMANVKLRYNCSPTDYCYVYTDANGLYTLYSGENPINVTPVMNDPYFIFSPTDAVVTFASGTDLMTQDFCLTPNGFHPDLEVSIIPTSLARPGFDATYKIIYKNKGNQTQSGSMSLTYDDAVLDLVNATPVATEIPGNLSWTFIDLDAYETREITVVFNVNTPMETPPVVGGDLLSFTASVTGSLSDETPDDNIFTLNQTVVNSLDPNDKTCLEGNSITPGMVGKEVHYLIRFENTGTAAAQNIVVADLIDIAKFDIGSLVPLNASHAFTTKIINGNRVEFIFENINLPFDDANNDGYVAFKIKTKPSLILGNTFSNTASIYFDYNFPIVTNTATTTVALLSNSDFEFDQYFKIYPNPANDILNIETKKSIEVTSINIYNTLGQVVLVIPNAQQTKSVDVSSLKTGNYFVKINSDKGSSSVKFVKL